MNFLRDKRYRKKDPIVLESISESRFSIYDFIK